MNRAAISLSAILVLGVCSPLNVAADDSGAEVSKREYKAPPGAQGMPKTSTSGGTRSNGQTLPTIELIAPGHEITTYVDSPTLVWQVDGSYPHGVLLELADLDDLINGQHISKHLPGPLSQGPQRYSLEKNHYQLRNRHRYEWSVSLCLDKECTASSEMPRAFTVIRKEEVTAKSNPQNDWFQMTASVSKE